MNQVQIIADSISPQGHRITTFVCTFWRALLAEVNTHRMLTRNSASSRAIPFKKMVEKVQNDPFIPMKWMKEHTGMQGTEYFTDEETITYKGDKYPTPDFAMMSWLASRDSAVQGATHLDSIGVSKQICNRLLEPFLHHTALITGTEFENFFALRAHPMAEIHFADLAQKMLDAYNTNEPKQLKAGEWHMPFGDSIDFERLDRYHRSNEMDWDIDARTSFKQQQEVIKHDTLKIATARCARISYGTFEGKDDYEADIKLHDRLASSGHWSPMEHCARAMDDTTYKNSGTSSDGTIGWSGNFRGFEQYRKLFSNENAKDMRVKQWTTI